VSRSEAVDVGNVDVSDDPAVISRVGLTPLAIQFLLPEYKADCL